jgi:hypothetical protein
LNTDQPLPNVAKRPTGHLLTDLFQSR